VIDGCDDCGQQLSDNDVDDGWGKRQGTTSLGRMLWINDGADVHFYDGASAALLQAGDVNDPALANVADFVFHLGRGAGAGEVIGAWRRGTDFAWIYRNDGQPPKLVNATNPYNAAFATNPEAVTIADGCVFFTLQSFDPDSPLAIGIKHVYQVDVDTGNATLLTGDFLDDGNTAGSGASPIGFVTSGCKAAWFWCGETDDNFECQREEMHYFDGNSVVVLEENAAPMGFEQGRLIYVKPVNGVRQVFLYDTNLANPAPVQLTDFSSSDPRVIVAATDGRHVAILRGDAGGQNRDMVTPGGFAVTDAETQPANSPDFQVPIQLDRGQLHWETHEGSYMVFDGHSLGTVCSQGWLADGFIGQSRKTDVTGDDSEVFLKQLGGAADPALPYSPWFLTAEATANGEVTLNWEPILGATSYNIYYANEPGVAQGNFAGLAGGQMLTVGASNSATISELSSEATWYFVVTAVDENGEGPDSPEASEIPCADAALDEDGDGTPDCEDGCPDDAVKTEPGDCGCGHPDEDANGNGISDCDDNAGGNDNGNDNAGGNGNDNDNNGPEDNAAVTACGADGACGGASAMPLAALMVSMQAARRRMRRQRATQHEA
jgi:hypothetical protein